MKDYIIAKQGKYLLARRTFIGSHEYTTHDIEVCVLNKDGTRYTIANFTGDKEFADVCSLMNRMLESIDTIDDLSDLNLIVDIGLKLIKSEEYNLGTKEYNLGTK